MAVYAVCYDLRKSGQDYSGLYEAIKGYGNWMHYLDSTWFIKTNQTPQQIFDTLKPHIDDNDYLLIIEVKNNKQGWLPEEAWEWFRQAFQ